MKVGDLVKLSFAEGVYHALVIGSDHPPSYPDRVEWTVLFCDDSMVQTYTQESFDMGDLEMEVISESRKQEVVNV